MSGQRSTKIVVIGSPGQLGTDLMKVAQAQGRNLFGLARPELDISHWSQVEQRLGQIGPQIVVNTAAAHGASQSTAEEQEAFFRVNALGAWNLARWCWQHEALLIHYSTDYVFGAEPSRSQPYTEADLPCPTNLYGSSKVAGELLIRSFCPRHYILRIASVYGAAGCRAKGNSNFVKMTLRKMRAGESMQVVADQIMSPTWTRAAAIKTFELLDAHAPWGLYHLAGSGACSWYEFAHEIVSLSRGKITVTPTVTPPGRPDDLLLRPRYTALDNANLRRAGLPDLPPWREALESYLNETERRFEVERT